jgi:hypothetical protein
MNTQIEAMLESIRQMEHDIEWELKRIREGLKVDFEASKVRFEHEVLAQQKRFKMGVFKYIFNANIKSFLAAPLIYAVFFPMVLLDLFVWVYQWVCFPLFGLARVVRSAYFGFADFGDAKGYQTQLEMLNARLAALKVDIQKDEAPPSKPPKLPAA